MSCAEIWGLSHDKTKGGRDDKGWAAANNAPNGTTGTFRACAGSAWWRNSTLAYKSCPEVSKTEIHKFVTLGLVWYHCLFSLKIQVLCDWMHWWLERHISWMQNGIFFKRHSKIKLLLSFLFFLANKPRMHIDCKKTTIHKHTMIQRTCV